MRVQGAVPGIDDSAHFFNFSCFPSFLKGQKECIQTGVGTSELKKNKKNIKKTKGNNCCSREMAAFTPAPTPTLPGRLVLIICHEQLLLAVAIHVRVHHAEERAIGVVNDRGVDGRLCARACV
jgi:hypothetical protein